MNDAFVRELKTAFAQPEVKVVAGEDRLLVPPGWMEQKREVHTITSLHVATLTGLLDYLRHGVDSLTLADCLLHVKDPWTVVLRGKVEPEERLFRRQTHIEATTALLGQPFKFDHFMDAETFTIAFQTGFIRTPKHQDVWALIASIRENAVRDTVDDSVAQTVKTARGVAFVEMTPVPNPVELQPFRTFREVEQPRSSFVLRLRRAAEGSDKPLIALFEGDGGRWKLDAITAIADYLRDALEVSAITLPVIA